MQQQYSFIMIFKQRVDSSAMPVRLLNLSDVVEVTVTVRVCFHSPFSLASCIGHVTRGPTGPQRIF